MFKIINSDLPNLIISTDFSAPLSNTELINFGKSVANLVLYADPISITTGTILPSGDNYIFELPIDSPEIIKIIIEGIDYFLPANPDLPTAGEFIVVDNIIIIYPIVSISINIITIIFKAAENSPGKLKTNYILPSYDALFSKWNLQGSISINRNFKDHPSATISFIASNSHLISIKSTFKNGCKFIFMGIGFLVSSVAIKYLSNLKYPGNWLQVDVNFSGCWSPGGSPSRSKIDKPISLKQLAKLSGKTNLSAICNASGVSMLSQNIDVLVPNNTPSTSMITARQAIEDRAITIHGFPFYSNPNQVQIKSWLLTQTHYLSNGDILGQDVTISTPGFGALVDSTQLTNEYRNTLLGLDNQEKEENGQEDYELWEFENALNFQDVLTPYLPKMELFSDDFGKFIFNLSTVFDLGGVTKSAKRSKYKNGTLIEEELTRYGYQYTSKDLYDINIQGGATTIVPKVQLTWNLSFFEVFVQQKWLKIEQTKTVFNFAKTGGYLLSQIESGNRRARYKQESDTGLESVIAYAEGLSVLETPNEPLIESQLYDFKLIPTIKTTEYTLKNLSDYYSDIKKPKDDNNWIEPKFASLIETREDTLFTYFETVTKADNKKVEYTSGKQFIEKQGIEIITPVTKDSTKKTPEKFRTIHYTQNKEGEKLKQSLTLSNSTESNGRPSIHQRLELTSKDSKLPQTTNSDNKFKYYLNSFGAEYNFVCDDSFPAIIAIAASSSTVIVEENSISYPGISDPNIALLIAKTQLSIDNTLNACITTLQVTRNTSYQEGNLIIWNSQKWVILGITDNIKIGKLNNTTALYSDSFQIKLGKVLVPSVVMSKVEL